VITLQAVWALIEFVGGLRSARELALIPTVLSVTDIPLCTTLEICTLVADFHIPIIPFPKAYLRNRPEKQPSVPRSGGRNPTRRGLAHLWRGRRDRIERCVRWARRVPLPNSLCGRPQALHRSHLSPIPRVASKDSPQGGAARRGVAASKR
jgi:hypothetical protein